MDLDSKKSGFGDFSHTICQHFKLKAEWLKQFFLKLQVNPRKSNPKLEASSQHQPSLGSISESSGRSDR